MTHRQRHKRSWDLNRRRTKHIPLRILICGGRDWTNADPIRRELQNILDNGEEIECVIHGDCRGADRVGAAVAKSLGLDVLAFPANWKRYNKAAGPIRNQQMIDEGKPTRLLAFHTEIEQSTGTKDMVTRALKAHIPVYTYKS